MWVDISRQGSDRIGETCESDNALEGTNTERESGGAFTDVTCMCRITCARERTDPGLVPADIGDDARFSLPGIKKMLWETVAKWQPGRMRSSRGIMELHGHGSRHLQY